MTKEKIQRTNVFKGEFSPSGIATADCLRKFYYTKILGLKPKTTNAALVYGSAIHRAVETFYSLRNVEQALTFEEIQRQVIQSFVQYWNEVGIIGDKKRNLEGGILTVGKYCDEYKNDLASYLIEDIESDQWFPMSNGTTLLVKIDRILNQNGLIIVDDTKTTSMAISDYYFRQFENHLPTTLYFHVVEQLLGHCDNIRIDAIKVPYPSARSTSQAFGRQLFMRTPLQIEDALISYSDKSNRIMDTINDKPKEEWPKHFCCNQSKCNEYSGCPFLNICKHGLDHTSVMLDFDIEETQED